jgi:hypothetical protein
MAWLQILQCSINRQSSSILEDSAALDDVQLLSSAPTTLGLLLGGTAALGYCFVGLFFPGTTITLVKRSLKALDSISLDQIVRYVIDSGIDKFP